MKSASWKLAGVSPGSKKGRPILQAGGQVFEPTPGALDGGCGAPHASCAKPRPPMRCFCGNRGSNRYTRMFVSTRVATDTDLFACPASVSARFGRGDRFFAEHGFTSPLPLGRLIKQCQAFFDRELFCRPSRSTYWHHSNCFSGRDPLQFIPRPDSVLIRNRFGDCQLQLGRYS